jgi:hypothetical protein
MASGFFDFAQSYSEIDIQPLVRRHATHFKLRRRAGFGRFIWKPFIILKKLDKVPFGPFVVYSDLRNHIHQEGLARFNAYLNQITKEEKSLGVFAVGDAYKAINFVRKRYVEAYHPKFYEDIFFKEYRLRGAANTKKDRNHL